MLQTVCRFFPLYPFVTSIYPAFCSLSDRMRKGEPEGTTIRKSADWVVATTEETVIGQNLSSSPPERTAKGHQEHDDQCLVNAQWPFYAYGATDAPSGLDKGEETCRE